MKRHFLTIVLTILLLLTAVGAYPAASGITNDDLEQAITETVEAKRRALGLSKRTPLFASGFSGGAGTSGSDWFAFGVGRCGLDEDLLSYRVLTEQHVVERYAQPDKLDAQKATEWHRISLTLLALGGDPTDVEGINLIADGTYNRGLTEPLDAQGINGVIWGLITVDAMRYLIPDDAHETRVDMIHTLLESQMKDGQFTLDGTRANVDITGMALQALAPYCNDRHVYEIDGRDVTVRAAVDRAVEWLSSVQNDDGSFSSMGESTAESCAQVIVALSSLGIDADNDPRFLKNGHSALDGLMTFKLKDGGFTHSFVDDPENPGAKAGEANDLASGQALYALCSLYRYRNGMRSLHDLRPERSDELKEAIATLDESLAKTDPAAIATEEVKALYDAYLDIPLYERDAVRHYPILEDLLYVADLPVDHPDLALSSGETTSGPGDVTDIFSGEHTSGLLFNAADLEEYEALPETLTGEHYVTVARLYGKLKAAENASDYEAIMTDLETKKAEIEAIRSEIEAINREIAASLYPFDEIDADDRPLVEDLMARADRLSEYDRAQILAYEDLQRADASLRSGSRALRIGLIVAAGVALAAVGLWLRIRQRRRDKMPEHFGDEIEPGDNDD